MLTFCGASSLSTVNDLSSCYRYPDRQRKKRRVLGFFSTPTPSCEKTKLPRGGNRHPKKQLGNVISRRLIAIDHFAIDGLQPHTHTCTLALHPLDTSDEICLCVQNRLRGEGGGEGNIHRSLSHFQWAEGGHANPI